MADEIEVPKVIDKRHGQADAEVEAPPQPESEPEPQPEVPASDGTNGDATPLEAATAVAARIPIPRCPSCGMPVLRFAKMFVKIDNQIPCFMLLCPNEHCNSILTAQIMNGNEGKPNPPRVRIDPGKLHV